MLFGQDRNQMRQFFCQVWDKQQTQQTLEPLEQIIATIIDQHPEYQTLLSDSKRAQDLEFQPEFGETNPFLHMGMHIAIQEQLTMQRPVGIRDVYQRLAQRHGDTHMAEHQMMEILAETLWQAQRTGTAPDETQYLYKLQQLCNN